MLFRSAAVEFRGIAAARSDACSPSPSPRSADEEETGDLLWDGLVDLMKLDESDLCLLLPVDNTLDRDDWVPICSARQMLPSS